MGDSGSFYVDPNEAPIYRTLLPLCHLLLPNQFELETLTETNITDTSSLLQAVAKLHKQYHVPHVFVTSTHLKPEGLGSAPTTLTLFGSTASSDSTPRPFMIEAPYHPAYFVGTGDAFAALMTARLRHQAQKADLLGVDGWVSGDAVPALELPLAKSAELVVASMQAILLKTFERHEDVGRSLDTAGSEALSAQERHLRLTKSLELRVVGNVSDLIDPPDVEQYRAREIHHT
jgi:pyridoxine kinase